MASFSKVPCMSKALDKEKLLYIACVTEETVRLTIHRCACFALNVHEAHVSFPYELGVRRLVLMTEAARQKLQGVLAPAIVTVTSSTDFEFTDEDDTPTCLVLVDDIDINPCPDTTLFPPKAPSESTRDVDGMPFLMLEQLIGCNCYKTDSKPSPVVVTGTVVEELTQQAEALQIADNETHSITFTIKGSTYEDEYQCNLKAARQTFSEHGYISAYFLKEPTNPRDLNAIAIYVRVGDDELKVGYVPGPRTQQISKAITTKDISSCKVTNITRRYVPSAGRTVYSGELSVLSSAKLSDVDNDYYYNKPQ